MTQDDYDLKPPAEPTPTPGAAPKPGEPGWIPPQVIIEKANEIDARMEDAETNKGMAILAYICFLIPLIAAPKSGFAKFHANQGLLSFMVWCAAILGNVVLLVLDWSLGDLLKKLSFLGMFFSCVLTLLQPALILGALALTIFGIVQAANGEWKQLPLIGQITLIKT
jgi:uncharacterized membrane protein